MTKLEELKSADDAYEAAYEAYQADCDAAYDVYQAACDAAYDAARDAYQAACGAAYDADAYPSELNKTKD